VISGVRPLMPSKAASPGTDGGRVASINLCARNNLSPGSERPYIVHSDRGSQFRSGKFLRALRSAGLIGSMGRTGTCADNAAMESFFALVQGNVFDRQRWQTREELRLAVVVWIERTYHRRRRQRAWASSPRSSSKPFTRLLMQREYCQPASQLKVTQSQRAIKSTRVRSTSACHVWASPVKFRRCPATVDPSS